MHIAALLQKSTALQPLSDVVWVLSQDDVGDEEWLARDEAFVARHVALELLALVVARLVGRVLERGLQQPVLELRIRVPQRRKVAHCLHRRQTLLKDVARALKVSQPHIVVRERGPQRARLVRELRERATDERLHVDIALALQRLRVRGAERRELQPELVLAAPLARLEARVVEHAHQLPHCLGNLSDLHQVLDVVLHMSWLQLHIRALHAREDAQRRTNECALR